MLGDKKKTKKQNTEPDETSEVGKKNQKTDRSGSNKSGNNPSPNNLAGSAKKSGGGKIDKKTFK